MPYLSQMAKNQNDKGTLLSQTLKLRFLAIWPGCGHFLIITPKISKLKSKIWPYLGHVAENHKIKGTLLSSALKFQYSKVLSDFEFLAF